MRHWVWLLAACDNSVDTVCTDIGCSDGFNVTFQHEAWTTGDYVVTVTLDGVVITCSATIPLVEGEGGCPEDSGVMLQLSGSMLPVDQQSLSGLVVNDTAVDEVQIHITLDGNPVTSETLTPAWETPQPNGPDCPPTCRSAAAVMAF